MIWPLRLWHALTKVLPFRSRSRVLHWQTWDPVHVTRLSCLISFLLSHQETSFHLSLQEHSPPAKMATGQPPWPVHPIPNHVLSRPHLSSLDTPFRLALKPKLLRHGSSRAREMTALEAVKVS
jgi:hypothetical protein